MYSCVTGLDLLNGWPVLSAHTFASNWQLPFLNKRKGTRMYVAGPSIEPGTSGSWVKRATDCATRLIEIAAEETWSRNIHYSHVHTDDTSYNLK